MKLTLGKREDRGGAELCICSLGVQRHGTMNRCLDPRRKGCGWGGRLRRWTDLLRGRV